MGNNFCVPVDDNNDNNNTNSHDTQYNDDINDDDDEKGGLLQNLTTIRGANLTKEIIIGKEIPVGIFIDQYLTRKYMTQNVDMNDRSEEEKEQMLNIAIISLSLIAKTCISENENETGTLSELAKDYMRNSPLVKKIEISEQDLQIAFKGESNIKDYPWTPELNPFLKYGSTNINNLEATQKEIKSILLVTCIMAAAQDGLSRAQLNTVYHFADKLQVERSYVKRLLHILKLEQELFLKMKQLW